MPPKWGGGAFCQLLNDLRQPWLQLKIWNGEKELAHTVVSGPTALIMACVTWGKMSDPLLAISRMGNFQTGCEQQLTLFNSPQSIMYSLSSWFIAVVLITPSTPLHLTLGFGIGVLNEGVSISADSDTAIQE